ncbi:hypothetical protein [Aeromonas veronii]|uniref:hypothetical protein n=1 Tax=Aeromonas veronii TaxID=654 RepID=UPI003D1EF312
MKKSAMTLAALMALSTNAFAAEEVAATTATTATTGGTAGGVAATGAAIGTTTAVAIGVGVAALTALVVSEAGKDNTGTATINTATK